MMMITSDNDDDNYTNTDDANYRNNQVSYDHRSYERNLSNRV